MNFVNPFLVSKTVRATNGHILQWIKNLDTDNKCLHFKDYETIIPARFLKIINRYVQEKTEVGQSENYLSFKLDYAIEFMVRAISEPYVDYQRVIPIELPNTLIVYKKKQIEQIKSAKPFTEKAMLKANNGSIEFNAEDMDMGLKYQSSMEVKNREGDELDVYLNLDLLERTVNNMDAGSNYTAAKIKVTRDPETDSPIVFYSQELSRNFKDTSDTFGKQHIIKAFTPSNMEAVADTTLERKFSDTILAFKEAISLLDISGYLSRWNFTTSFKCPLDELDAALSRISFPASRIVQALKE